VPDDQLLAMDAALRRGRTRDALVREAVALDRVCRPGGV